MRNTGIMLDQSFTLKCDDKFYQDLDELKVQLGVTRSDLVRKAILYLKSDLVLSKNVEENFEGLLDLDAYRKAILDKLIDKMKVNNDEVQDLYKEYNRTNDLICTRLEWFKTALALKRLFKRY